MNGRIILGLDIDEPTTLVIDAQQFGLESGGADLTPHIYLTYDMAEGNRRHEVIGGLADIITDGVLINEDVEPQYLSPSIYAVAAHDYYGWLTDDLHNPDDKERLAQVRVARHELQTFPHFSPRPDELDFMIDNVDHLLDNMTTISTLPIDYDHWLDVDQLFDMSNSEIWDWLHPYAYSRDIEPVKLEVYYNFLCDLADRLRYQ